MKANKDFEQALRQMQAKQNELVNAQGRECRVEISNKETYLVAWLITSAGGDIINTLKVMRWSEGKPLAYELNGDLIDCEQFYDALDDIALRKSEVNGLLDEMRKQTEQFECDRSYGEYETQVYCETEDLTADGIITYGIVKEYNKNLKADENLFVAVVADVPIIDEKGNIIANLGHHFVQN